MNANDAHTRFKKASRWRLAQQFKVVDSRNMPLPSGGLRRFTQCLVQAINLLQCAKLALEVIDDGSRSKGVGSVVCAAKSEVHIVIDW